jgi:putative nucleotidyltransferase with HDIG domain
MVNVSALAMAQARALNIQGPLLREFGFAALMHDMGKVNTPLEVLNKPDKLTKDEFEMMKRHVIDGAHILRRTPEMPALAPIVAFEHHLKQDLSRYPEAPLLVNTWERDGRGEHLRAVVEAVDPEPLAIDPLAYL